MITGGSGATKTNTLINLINEKKDIDKIYLYAKDLSEFKYQLLIERRKNTGIKHFNDPNAFVKCSNTMHDVYENIDNYNPSKKKNFNCL